MVTIFAATSLTSFYSVVVQTRPKLVVVPRGECICPTRSFPLNVHINPLPFVVSNETQLSVAAGRRLLFLLEEEQGPRPLEECLPLVR